METLIDALTGEIGLALITGVLGLLGVKGAKWVQLARAAQKLVPVLVEGIEAFKNPETPFSEDQLKTELSRRMTPEQKEHVKRERAQLAEGRGR